MFEKYLDLEGFDDIGSSDVYDAKLSLNSKGVFRTHYFYDVFVGFVKDLRISYNKSARVVCFVAELTEKSNESLDKWEINKIVEEKVTPLIENLNGKPRDGFKFVFKGEVYKSERKAFFDIAHPTLVASPTGRRKVEDE